MTAQSAPLQGRRVAFLATDGVEEAEYAQPRAAAEQAGADVDLVSPQPGAIQAMRGLDRSARFDVDRTLDQADPADYDALVLPGGAINPDRLRMNPQAVAFALTFFMQAKPVAAICHGPWTLVEADVVRGRTLTSWPSLETDIRNAGGEWTDEEVHVDNGLVTSRKPDDLPAFCDKLAEEICEGRHDKQALQAAGSGASS
jgi:protease I